MQIEKMNKQRKGYMAARCQHDNARLKWDKTNMKVCGSLRDSMYVVLLFREETPKRLETASFEQPLVGCF